MTKLRKIVLMISLLILLSNHGFSQLSATFNYSSLSKIGLGYQFSTKIFTEFRMISNTKMDDIGPELIIGYNAINRDRHNVYIGFGATINYLSGLVLPIGLEFYPIESFDNFSLKIEFEPTYTVFDTEELLFMSSAGIKYRFGDKK